MFVLLETFSCKDRKNKIPVFLPSFLFAALHQNKVVWSIASGRTKEVVLLAQQHPGKLKVWHSLRHCRESCPSEQNAAVIACFSVLSDRILYTDGRRQRRVRGTHVFEPSDRCTHCTCFSGPTPRSSPLPAFTLYSSLRDGGLRWCHEP